MKKTLIIILVMSAAWSCATRQPPPPTLYLGNLPATLVAELSLEDRLRIEEAWNNLRKGEGGKAEKIISKLGTQSPAYNIGLGYAYLLLNKFQTAEEVFKKALKNHPDWALIHSGLAQVYQKTGREDQAFSEFREILKREPEHPWAKPQYETLKKKKVEEGLKEAENSLRDGNLEKSKEALLKTLFYSPQLTEAHLKLAEIYKKENNLQSALLHLKAANTIEPENREILKNYADTLFQADRKAKSLEIYEKLQERDPENREIADRIESLKSALGIFELPSQYNSIPFSKAVSKEEIAALIAIKLKGILEEQPSTPPIIIDISTSWAAKFIIQTASLGILDIYPNHTFQPKKIITRAETAEILLRLIHYLEKKGYKLIRQIPLEKVQVRDVPPQNYYHKPITEVLSYDIMDLTMNQEFRPDLPVSGDESIRLLDIVLSLIK